MQNKAFVVDTSKLKHVADVLSADTGSWINNGQHTFHCCTKRMMRDITKG